MTTALLLITLAFIFPGQAGTPGVVVESTSAGAAAERAGLKAGDRIVSWRQGTEAGPLRTPLDLGDTEEERGPRGPVSLAGERADGSAFEVSLVEEAWGVQARPDLPGPLVALLERARASEKAGQSPDAAATLADAAAKTTDPAWASWLHLQSANAWAAGARWEESQHEYEAALVGLDPRDAAAVWMKRAAAYKGANSLSGVGHAYEEAGRLLESAGDEGLRYAETLRKMADLTLPKDRAILTIRRAAAIGEELAPDSLFLARLWTSEAVQNFYFGDRSRSLPILEKAHAIQARKAPGTLAEAITLIDLGVFAQERGDLATAEASLRRATSVLDQGGINDIYRAAAHANLGAVLARRGDLDAAEDAFLKSLEIGKDLPALASAAPIALVNLGELASARGDLARAEEYQRKALDMTQSVSPDWAATIGPLNHLGALAVKRGDLDRAESFFRQALSRFAALADPPGSISAMDTFLGLGDVARARGDSSGAEEQYQRVVQASKTWRPGSFEEADALGRIASLRAEAGRTRDAAALYADAVQALERQRTQLGSGQEQGSQRMATFSRTYADYVGVLLALGRPEEAFRVAEASRARTLLELLARRDLAFGRDIPPELEHERQQVKTAYDRVLAEQDGQDPQADPEAAARISARLRELQQERLRIASDIRNVSPALAEIEDPRPVSAAETRRALDPGTLFLSYLVGERRTVLFAVGPEGRPTSAPGGVATFEIAAGRDDLQQRVGAFLALVQDRSVEATRLTASAQDLYRLLLQPAEALLSESPRVLISPEGPLQTLPFAALMEPGSGGRRPRFLAERKPLHMIASATLYAELRQRRRRRADHDGRIAAFGDPVYPRGRPASDEVALRSGVRGRDLSPLPGTGAEAREIARLFPKDTQTFLGADATEENAKSLPRNTRCVHFGCHALLNPRSPLDSALVLSVPESLGDGRENGLLQAWEIFEDLRLDADVVTLSACESGLGADIAGEGLIGLTRAFQYAGARSVLASLWNVADDSTAELMGAFYRGLKHGKPRDEALQEAQIAMIRRGYSPFHWAAFQLTGDRR